MCCLIMFNVLFNNVSCVVQWWLMFCLIVLNVLFNNVLSCLIVFESVLLMFKRERCLMVAYTRLIVF
jgi:hypothetical protein